MNKNLILSEEVIDHSEEIEAEPICTWPPENGLWAKILKEIFPEVQKLLRKYTKEPKYPYEPHTETARRVYLQMKIVSMIIANRLQSADLLIRDLYIELSQGNFSVPDLKTRIEKYVNEDSVE